MLSGLLIANAFLHSSQTDETYRKLLEGAKRHDINMRLALNSDFLVRIDNDDVTNIPAECDFILFWNKDITLGRALENHGLRLFNPSEGIRLCDSKALTTQHLAGIVDMPKTIKIPMTFNGIGYTDLNFLDLLEREFTYPFVIKECFGSYGGQVYLATDRQKASSILKQIEGTDCIAQEYISKSFGRDLRAYVVGDRVVAAIERNNPNDFRANIANGGSAKKYDLTPLQEEMAVKATKALGLDFAGVDLLFMEADKPILCEVNSNAQFKGLQDATGIDITDAIFEHINQCL